MEKKYFNIIIFGLILLVLGLGSLSILLKENYYPCKLIQKEVQGEYFECIECYESSQKYALTCNFQNPRG